MTNDTTGPRYDYTNQAWTVDGRYVDCCHPAAMNCTCYGRKHAGEPAPEPTPSAHFARAGGWWVATIDGTGTDLDGLGRHWTGYTDSTTPEELVKALGPILQGATITFEQEPHR